MIAGSPPKRRCQSPWLRITTGVTRDVFVCEKVAAELGLTPSVRK